MQPPQLVLSISVHRPATPASVCRRRQPTSPAACNRNSRSSCSQTTSPRRLGSTDAVPPSVAVAIQHQLQPLAGTAVPGRRRLYRKMTTGRILCSLPPSCCVNSGERLPHEEMETGASDHDCTVASPLRTSRAIPRKKTTKETPILTRTALPCHLRQLRRTLMNGISSDGPRRSGQACRPVLAEGRRRR